MRSRMVAAMTASAVVAGCVTQPPQMTSALPPAVASIPAEYEPIDKNASLSKNGNVVVKSGDHGQIKVPGSAYGGWSVECRQDPMDDQRECKTVGPFGGLFFIAKGKGAPTSACVFGHNDPRVPAQIRFGSKAPLTTDLHGCLPWGRVKDGLLNPQPVTTEWFSIPGGMHNTMTPAAVIEDVMTLARELQTGPVAMAAVE